MPRLRPRVYRGNRNDGRIPVADTDRDNLVSAVVKMVPIEIIATYEFVDGITPATSPSTALWISIILIIITPLWVLFAATDRTVGERLPIRQAILSTCAYAIWIIGTQEAVVMQIITVWESWMGSVVLSVGAVSLAIFEGILKNLGITQDL